MILRILGDTSWVLSISSQIKQMYVAFTRKEDRCIEGRNLPSQSLSQIVVEFSEIKL